jgi:hypothetical protein
MLGIECVGVLSRMTNLALSLSLSLIQQYQLPGQLIKWYSLYKKAPGPDSWAWKWYDGFVC